MDNLFNKRKPTNPISDIFGDLSTNQKMSVINLLQIIAVCDAGQGNRDKELQYINSYIDILAIPSDKCIAYFESKGHNRIITDLISLRQNQKELLAFITWEMIICDAKANETEVSLAVDIFKQIGISEEKFVTSIEKNRAILNQILK